MDPLDNMAGAPVPKNFDAENAQNNEDVRHTKPRYQTRVVTDSPPPDREAIRRQGRPAHADLLVHPRARKGLLPPPHQDRRRDHGAPQRGLPRVRPRRQGQ